MFVPGLIEWSGQNLEVGSRLDGEFVYSQFGGRQEVVSICLPFHPVMTPVGLMKASESTKEMLGEACGQNPFCLHPKENGFPEFHCEACGHVFHDRCLVPIDRTCGCLMIGEALKR